MSLTDTHIPRLDELIHAVGHATPETPDEADELAEVVQGLQELKDQRLQQARHRIRVYCFAGLKRAFQEAQAETPDIPPEDFTALVVQQLATLLSDDGQLLEQVLAGVVTE